MNKVRRLINRTGERFKTKEELGGYEIIIIEYNGRTDVTIQFQDEYKTILKHRTYQDCQKGRIKNPYHPSVYGIGYIGQGKYKAYINGKRTKEYDEWIRMLQRGFNEEFKKEEPTYKDVTVEEWLFNFQNYCKWREDNYYEIEGEQMQLDKDILCKGNKIYSRDTMIFVPQRINKLFIKNNIARGDLPIGVHYHKRDRVYEVNCRTLNGQKYLGRYNTPEEAFQVYKTFKEQYIKEVADEYKGRIPDRLYEAMYKYVVEEND